MLFNFAFGTGLLKYRTFMISPIFCGQIGQTDCSQTKKEQRRKGI